MRRLVLLLALASVPLSAQSGGDLPRDVRPDSRNRLPPIARESLNEQGRKAYDAAAINAPGGRPEGAVAIRLHRSGVDVRWQSPVGRALTELAIISTAREHDQPYEWSLHEMEAVAVGVDPAVIDIVRNRKALIGAGEKQGVVIQLAREIGRHKVSPETYARALKAFGESDLVDIVSLMGNYAGTATRLSAVNQQMPPGWKQFLPLPFTPPADIHPDSRSRLPLIRTPAAPPSAPPSLYSRQMAPEGTGPGQIGRHGAGLKSLETSVGRRLMSVAVLVTARAHDQQYDWTIGEIAARKDGLEPATIDVIREMKSPAGLGDKEAVIIQFGRELFGRHYVSADTYAHALQLFGERDLVDFVNLMAQHADDATMLTAFDQRLPAGEKPLLPMP
jgi:4-carboxymuconolactone decarboxylase